MNAPEGKGWIPVKEYPPTMGDKVEVYADSFEGHDFALEAYVMAADEKNAVFEARGSILSDVTHWRPMEKQA